MDDEMNMFKRIGEDISFDDLVDFSAGDEIASSVIRDASSEGTATQAGLQTKSLQSAIDNYANAMNQVQKRDINLVHTHPIRLQLQSDPYALQQPNPILERATLQ